MSTTSEAYDLTSPEAAKLIGCHAETLKRWALDAKIPAFRSPGGHWKFRRSDVEAFLAKSQGPGAAALTPVEPSPAPVSSGSNR